MKRQGTKKRFVAKNSKADKRQRYWLKRIYRLLASDRVAVVFKRYPKWRGWCNYKRRTLFLDPANNILPTIIHESLHYLYDNWSEGRVERIEVKIFNSLNSVRLKYLLNRLTAAVNAWQYTAIKPNGKDNKYLLGRIYKLLASGQVGVVFKRFRKWQSYCEYRTATLFLNPFAYILPSLISVSLLFLYPDWTYTKVYKMSSTIFNSLSPAQIKHLLNHLTAAVNATKRSSLKTKKKG